MSYEFVWHWHVNYMCRSDMGANGKSSISIYMFDLRSTASTTTALTLCFPRVLELWWSSDRYIMYDINIKTNCAPLQRSWNDDILVLPCPSVRPSVRLSVCGRNRVRSVTSTIHTGFISYSYILPGNFIRYVYCKGFGIIHKFKFLAFLFKFVTLTLSCFDLRSDMNQQYG